MKLPHVVFFEFGVAILAILVVGMICGSRRMTWAQFLSTVIAIVVIQVALFSFIFLYPTKPDSAFAASVLGLIVLLGFICAAVDPPRPAPAKPTDQPRWRIDRPQRQGNAVFLDPGIMIDGVVITVSGDVAREEADAIAAQCLRLAAERSTKPVVIRITTGGGDTGYEDVISSHIGILASRRPVYAVAIGRCASAGMAILASVPAPYRYCTVGTQFMFHRCTLHSGGQVYGPEHLSGDPRSRIDILNASVLAKLRAGYPEIAREIEKIFTTGEDYHFDGPEAWHLGIVHGYLM
ncbi:MAG TPA: ATP-dependent Clp protease proteolytic subunit [Candidatus Saccharimonadia bacterium]